MTKRRIHDKLRREREGLTYAGKIVWNLHKSGRPLTIDELTKTLRPDLSEDPKDKADEKTNRELKRIKFRISLIDEIIPTLERQKIVRILRYGDKESYVLHDYSDDEAKVFFAIVDSVSHHKSLSAVDLALQLGLTPSRAEELAFKLGPITGWAPPMETDEHTQYTPTFLRLLELAAWIKLGCRDSKFVRSRWTNTEIKTAEGFLDLYPSYIPNISAFRDETKDKFAYSYVWPEPTDLSGPWWQADFKQFAGFAHLIKFQNRNQHELR